MVELLNKFATCRELVEIRPPRKENRKQIVQKRREVSASMRGSEKNDCLDIVVNFLIHLIVVRIDDCLRDSALRTKNDHLFHQQTAHAMRHENCWCLHLADFSTATHVTIFVVVQVKSIEQLFGKLGNTEDVIRAKYIIEACVIDKSRNTGIGEPRVFGQ